MADLACHSGATLLLGGFLVGPAMGFGILKPKGIQANVTGSFPYKTAKVPRLVHKD